MNDTIIRALAQGFVALADAIKDKGNQDTKEVLAGYEALVDAVRDSKLSEGADPDTALDELRRRRALVEGDRADADAALLKKFAHPKED